MGASSRQNDRKGTVGQNSGSPVVFRAFILEGCIVYSPLLLIVGISLQLPTTPCNFTRRHEPYTPNQYFSSPKQQRAGVAGWPAS